MRLVRKTGLFAQIKNVPGSHARMKTVDPSHPRIIATCKNIHIFTSKSGSQPVVISVQKSVQNARKILGVNPLILLDLPAASPHAGKENQHIGGTV